MASCCACHKRDWTATKPFHRRLGDGRGFWPLGEAGAQLGVRPDSSAVTTAAPWVPAARRGKRIHVFHTRFHVTAAAGGLLVDAGDPRRPEAGSSNTWVLEAQAPRSTQAALPPGLPGASFRVLVRRHTYLVTWTQLSQHLRRKRTPSCVTMKTKRCSPLQIIFALIKIFIEISQRLPRNSFCKGWGRGTGRGTANKQIQHGSSLCWSAVGWHVTNTFPETNLICWRSGQNTGVLGFASGEKHWACSEAG